ncbi:MAG: lipoyl synthase [bacterium]
MGGLPSWLRKKVPDPDSLRFVGGILGGLGLNTVCRSARCPNLGECFGRHVAAFMILGNVCTRNCGFCAIPSGFPLPVDEGEPGRIAEACSLLGLRHVVITSVTRDDLWDGGAGQFAATVRAIRVRLPDATVEILTPDFLGKKSSVLLTIEAEPHIFNHNIETVPRLYPTVRPRADYRRSLDLLEYAKSANPSIVTKSGLMVGLGEGRDEVIRVMRDLRGVGCDIITIGQYLSPSRSHLPVVEFVHPGAFREYESIGREMGFAFVASGPFVRSSYNAGEVLAASRKASSVD